MEKRRRGLDERSGLMLGACALTSASLFALDLRYERGLSLGIAQILVVLLSLRAKRTSVSVAGACLASLAIALGYAAKPPGSNDEAALANRALATGAVWVTALAGIAFERGAAAQRRLAEIVEASSDAISRVSPDGIVTAWNAGAERIYGRPAAAVIGTSVPEPVREILARAAQGERIETFESVHHRPDGTELELSVAVSPLHDAHGRISAISISARDISALKRAERELRELNDGLAQRVAARTADLRSLTAELLMVEESERRQLAQDLHDGLGQTLTLAIMRLGMLRAGGSPDPQATLAEIETLLCDAQRFATSMTFRLSPPILYDVGLVPALHWLCDELRRSYGLEVKLDDDDRPKTLDDQMRVVVFRCARELLINVARHAGTGSAQLSIRRLGDRVRVVVSDEGTGFDVETTRRQGFGLASVRERLEHLGGHLEIESWPGKGTRATIVAPLIHSASAETGA